jgi:ABC-type polysaccharide/polyol phosphate export permease
MKAKLKLLLYFLVRDIKMKYAGSALGIVWSFILPLLQILLFWFVFGGILKARPYATTHVPYIAFLLSSFFFWLAFSEGVVRASYTIVENSELVKKVNFPNVILPFSVICSTYLHHMIGFVIFFLLYVITYSISPQFLLIIPVLFLQLIFSLGLGMIFSAILPYIRDLSQIIGYLTQALFFLSPIIYSVEAMPEKLRFVIFFNPFTFFVTSYHKIILFRSPPQLLHIAAMVCLALVSFICGFYIFRKLKNGFADVL